MSPETELKVLAHVQHVAFHFVAWRGALSSLITFVSYSFGPGAPSPGEIDLFLRRKEVQELLSAKYDVGLWRAVDKSYRLVSLAPVTDISAAQRRLKHHPTNPGSQCRFCEIDEKGFANIELLPERDIHGEIVVASRCHVLCMKPWRLMRALVARAEE